MKSLSRNLLGHLQKTTTNNTYIEVIGKIPSKKTALNELSAPSGTAKNEVVIANTVNDFF